MEKKKTTLGIVGWVAFVVAILLMIDGLGNFIFYFSLFLTSFIISIILLTDRQILSGIALLLLTLIGPPVLWSGLFAYRVSDALNTSVKAHENEIKSEIQEKIKSIKFESIEIHSGGDYMYCEGKIRNEGGKTFDFIKVKVEWLDANDIIVDTDYAYAVGGEGLAPNEAKSFKIMTPADPKMKRGRYYLIE